MRTLNRKIDMICYTDPNGTIRPIRFRIQSKNYSKQTYVLQRILDVKALKLAGVKTLNYECKIVVNDQVKVCELKLELDSCKWTLFKI